MNRHRNSFDSNLICDFWFRDFHFPIEFFNYAMNFAEGRLHPPIADLFFERRRENNWIGFDSEKMVKFSGKVIKLNDDALSAVEF